MEDKILENENAEAIQPVVKRSRKDRGGIESGLIFGIIFVIIAFLIYVNYYELVLGRIAAYFLGICAFLFFGIALSSYFDYKESKRIEKIEEDALKEELEFSNINPEDKALKAEKLFKMNQKELMRYYDTNLAQTKFLTILGTIMIFVGMLVALVSLLLYVFAHADKVFLFTGSFSGIVVNCIGAVFIKMYTKNIEASVRFHSKFAESNNLLLANSIANKIEDVSLRENTLSDIAKNIALFNKDSKQ